MRRREFVASIGACAAHLAAAGAAGGFMARRLFAANPRGVVARDEPWGRLERVADGVWALVSTPLVDDPRASLTVANGGIVAGRAGVVLIEGLVSREGARWLAAAARELTGRAPDHVVLTHYHGDHSNGLAAHHEDGAAILHATRTTLETLRTGAAKRGREPATRGFAGDRLALVAGDRSTVLDLGDRRLWIRPALGHTDSDLWIVLDDPHVVWCGDLVWNGLVPNYVDAIPSRLSASVGALIAEPAEIWVPGHGDLADRSALLRYAQLIDDVEEAARRALAAGTPIEAAAAEYRPPTTLGEWVAFSPRYYEVAFTAWERELRD